MFVDSFYVLTVQPLGLPFDRFIRQNSRIMNGILTQKEAVALSLDFLYALKSFHDKGIVHRDVKLNNFLLLKQNNEIHVALTDYGISRTVKKNQKFVKNVTILQSDAHLMRRKTRMHEHEDHSVDIRVDKLKHTDLYKTAVVIKSILTNSRFKQIDDILDRILDPNTRSITTEEVIKMFERLLSDSKKIEKAPKPEPKTRVYNPAPKKAETVSPREQSNVFKPFKG